MMLDSAFRTMLSEVFEAVLDKRERSGVSQRQVDAAPERLYTLPEAEKIGYGDRRSLGKLIEEGRISNYGSEGRRKVKLSEVEAARKSVAQSKLMPVVDTEDLAAKFLRNRKRA